MYEALRPLTLCPCSTRRIEKSLARCPRQITLDVEIDRQITLDVEIDRQITLDLEIDR